MFYTQVIFLRLRCSLWIDRCVSVQSLTRGSERQARTVVRDCIRFISNQGTEIYGWKAPLFRDVSTCLWTPLFDQHDSLPLIDFYSKWPEMFWQIDRLSVHLHWRYHLDWRWTVCDQNTKLDHQISMKTNNMSYEQHIFKSIEVDYIVCDSDATRVTGRDLANACHRQQTAVSLPWVEMLTWSYRILVLGHSTGSFMFEIGYRKLVTSEKASLRPQIVERCEA